jgi:hypothetical protein
MREWLQAQLRSGFPALAGSVISGTVAISDDALNELLAKWLAENAAPRTDATQPADWRGSVRLINKARVKADNGRLLVEFEVVV